MDDNNNSQADDQKLASNKENVQPPLGTCKYKTVRPPNVTIIHAAQSGFDYSPYGAPESAGTYEVIPHRIFVGGFSIDTTEEDLRNCFKECGEIREVKIVRCPNNGIGKGYGFITFESDDEARAVRTSSERFELNGRRLNLGPAMRRIYQQKPSVQPMPVSPASHPPMPIPLYSYPIPMMPMFYAGPNGHFFGSQFVNNASKGIPPQMGVKPDTVRKRSSMKSHDWYMSPQQQNTPAMRSSISHNMMNSAPSGLGNTQSRFGGNFGESNYAPAVQQDYQDLYKGFYEGYDQQQYGGRQDYGLSSAQDNYWTQGNVAQQQSYGAQGMDIAPSDYDAQQGYWLSQHYQ